METASIEQQIPNADTQSEQQTPLQEKTKKALSDRATRLIGFLSKSKSEVVNPNMVLQTIAQGNVIESNSVDTQTEQLVKEAKKELRLFNKALEIMKAHPEFLGAGLSVALGALAMMADTPLPPGVLEKASSALGFASFGYGKGETQGEKFRNAAIGAVAGVTGLEGVGSIVGQEHAAKVNLVGGFVDDLVPAAGLAAGIVRGRGQARS